MISASLKRRAVAAGATIAIMSTVSHAVMPSNDPTSTSEQQRQASQAQRLTNDERRRAGSDLGYSVQADKLRSAEHRPPEHVARGIARSLLRGW